MHLNKKNFKIASFWNNNNKKKHAQFSTKSEILFLLKSQSPLSNE